MRCPVFEDMDVEDDMSRFCPNNVSYGGSYFSIGRRLSFVVDDSVNLSLPLCFPSLYPFCPSVCLRSRFPPLLLGEFRSGFSWLLLPPCLSLSLLSWLSVSNLSPDSLCLPGVPLSETASTSLLQHSPEHHTCTGTSYTVYVPVSWDQHPKYPG